MTSSGPGDPGSDSAPQDPFDRPPNESGTSPASSPGSDPTAPIQPGSYPGAYPGSAEQPVQPEPPGYWESQANQQQAPQNPYAQNPYGQAPPDPQQGYGQPGYPQPPSQPQPQGYGAPPQGYAAPYGYGQPGYGYAMTPTHSSATTSLVLGLVGLLGGLLCGVGLLASPFAIFVGRKTMREIDASNGQLGGRSNAKAGFVLGIIGTVLLVLAVGLIALVVVAGISSSSGSYTEY